MAIRTVTDAIRYVGADDNTLTLFENQYPVQPMGVSYNSYIILDEKIAVMDSVDARAAEDWISNVAQVLEGRSPDYLVVTHMEPDHSGSLMRLAQKYPEMKIVGNAKTFTLIKQFFGTGALSEERMLEVGEGSTISLGSHRLRFLLAPMVHWPEVMAAYEAVSYTHLDKILSFLVFLDSIQTANLPNIGAYITANEVNLCLSIQAFQECVHSQSYSYIDVYKRQTHRNGRGAASATSMTSFAI